MGQNNFNNQNSSTKYKIIDELGEGGFGKAYKVQNKIDKNFYVIKKIPIKLKNQEELQSIENEALILKEINNEYIVRYIESFMENEHFNIVMEYCENKDLKTFINIHKDRDELINEEVIYYIALDICNGIKEIHSKNLIHRDLKPENLFISKDYKIKIGDFGISKKLISSTNYANTQKGTFYYMAPEMINGQKYNNKVDMWALGCILYELLTLNYCFDCAYIGGLIKIINEGNHEKIDTSIYNKEWQNIIDLLLKVDYHERPEIDEVINMIEKIKYSIESSSNNDLDNISLNILNNKKEKGEKLENINYKIIGDIENEEGIKKSYKIVFVGESVVGAKTSLILRINENVFLKDTYSTLVLTPVIKYLKLKNGKIIILYLWDTAGQERYRGINSEFYMKDAHCIILGFDVTNKETFIQIKNYWYPTAKNLSSVKLIYLIGNKIDEKREINKEEPMNFAKENNLRYFETSCKTKEGVEEFFNDLVTEISKI